MSQNCGFSINFIPAPTTGTSFFGVPFLFLPKKGRLVSFCLNLLWPALVVYTTSRFYKVKHGHNNNKPSQGKLIHPPPIVLLPQVHQRSTTSSTSSNVLQDSRNNMYIQEEARSNALQTEKQIRSFTTRCFIVTLVGPLWNFFSYAAIIIIY